MKKLLSIYVGTIALIFTLPVLIGVLHGRTADTPEFVSDLPQDISVYFADEDVTREIDFEEYIKGVLPAEMPASFNIEALKAQAVAARTYSYHKYVKYSENPDTVPDEHKGAVICSASVHCAAYYSPSQLEDMHGSEWMSTFYPKIVAAVDETENEILVYGDEPILAVFHAASSGGSTESSEEVWGSILPYLVPADTAGEQVRDNYHTTATFSQSEFLKKLTEEYDVKIPDDKNILFSNITKTRGGSVSTIDICGITLKGTQVRSLFGLRSANFTVEILNDEVIFKVEGFGHGVGMSQYGANHMAENGSSYVEILENYYNGAELIRM